MLSTIITYVVEAILNWVAKFLGREIQQSKDNQAEDKAAQDSVQPLKDAKSAEEIDKGADDALGGF